MPHGDSKKDTQGENREIARLQERIRHLEKRLSSLQASPVRLWDLLTGPQRKLSPEEIQSEVQRLLVICAEQRIGAILHEVCTCRELLEALAIACHRSGLTSAGQYLTYLATPC